MVTHQDIIGECYKIARGFRDRALECLKPLSLNRSHSSLTELAYYVIERKK